MKFNFYTLIGLFLTCALFAGNKTSLTYNATIEGKQILTPAIAETPQINGATIFGVRPGKPIFYHVAVSGSKPITYAAIGLPVGVTIDPVSGWITGRAPQKAGSYKVALMASNSKGKAKKN